jgi:ribosomal RNA-processing protein 7
MAAFEDQEAEAERRAKLAAEQPDDDGFITVTHGSTPSFGAANDFEEEKHNVHRRKAGKRSRKRKATGADELSDFYRFQLKETRKKEVQDLKARFVEDLKKVKKLKEEKAYRPF